MVNLAGLCFVAFGVLCAARPYDVARFGEVIDAIGSTRSAAEVQPAEWNVTLTRSIGVVAVFVGIIMLFA